MREILFMWPTFFRAQTYVQEVFLHLLMKLTGIQVQQPTLHLHIVVDVLRLLKFDRVGSIPH